jgi:hypothetical protein
MLSGIGALIITDAAEAKARLLLAFETARGNREKVAKIEGVDKRTVYRWLTRLDAWNELDTMCEQKNFPRVPGPPRLRDRIVSAMVEARGVPARAARVLELDGGKDELLAKIAELHLFAAVNRALEGAGHPTLETPKAS